MKLLKLLQNKVCPRCVARSGWQWLPAPANRTNSRIAGVAAGAPSVPGVP